ncbi:MAG TPA: hypothetical protein P5079_11655, partial [Elusimicrobiota bacterium]|nr:hypothetical protein [Elusimicrobiota bacterium]
FWSRVHPRIYLGRGMALAALIFSAVVAYIAFSELAYAYMWRQTFQLTETMSTYWDPVENWSVLYPKPWSHEAARLGETILHTFKPSKPTPTMYFSVTTRNGVETKEIAQVVDGFLLNLPKDRGIHLLESEKLVLPGGQPAYRIVYSEQTRRIPVKNETLFVMDGTRLFYITVGAAPRWFDRQRVYLERLLYSLTLSSR